MKKLVFATNNAHKLSEIRAILSPHYEIASLAEIGCHDDIPETADTLEGNAQIKARWVKERYHFDCFADDTGLEVQALGGGPGVHTARYAFPDHHDPVANNAKLLRELSTATTRAARFRTVICLSIGEEEHLFEGIVDGEIAEEERGTEGFGYDPLFIPHDEAFNPRRLTFAQLGVEAKNLISHRARAVKRLIEYLGNKS